MAALPLDYGAASLFGLGLEHTLLELELETYELTVDRQLADEAAAAESHGEFLHACPLQDMLA